MNLLLLALIIPSFIDTSVADTQGSFQLYSDGDCMTSNGSPISAVPGSCVETNQASSIAAISFPSCSSGNAILLISDQTQCNSPSIQPVVQSGNIGDCLSLQTGAGIGSAAFICQDKVSTVDSQAAATTSKDPATSTTPDSSTTSTDSDQSSGQNPSGFSGMDLSDRIALGVGLGIGVPALVVAFLQWRNTIQHHLHHQLHPPFHAVPPGPPPPPYRP